MWGGRGRIITKNNMNKPDCYKCKWRRNLVGDCHSSCTHPDLGGIENDPLGKIMGIFASVGRVSPINLAPETMNIKASLHGIKNGWFNFPYNFDPVWLESCDGFTKKEGDKID